MSDAEVLTRLYRRAVNATGRRPYAFFVSRRLDPHPDHLFNVPVCVVPRKFSPAVAVARVEALDGRSAAYPDADWSVIDFGFEAELPKKGV